MKERKEALDTASQALAEANINFNHTVESEGAKVLNANNKQTAAFKEYQAQLVLRNQVTRRRR